MIFFGQGERVVAYGEVEKHRCPRCCEERLFQPQLRYKYGHIYALFGWVYSKRYELACGECGHGWVLDKKAEEAKLDKLPIPSHLQYGFMVFLVALISLAIIGAGYNGVAFLP
ncbi:hypothetical protein G7069_06545 [Lysobacter sp. HDW10]|jgi:hypothetical protein|uniref:hypothetical protein n=1 Tax=Lysobacter sp. HDW10 TaxID=2714936 RepID=UPI00140A1637|nr:hypothetical protein [Lysobacter sp. HDW10]QIK81286.1 hypothetical protein G7069_06545 [Lysobacter sp. HDW10]